jgi:D-aminopeptidase
VEVRFKDTAMADAATMMPGIERIAAMDACYEGRDCLEAFRALWVMITMATTERWERTA